jgi:hypothetical protein
MEWVNVFFIDGPAGTGKTLLYNALMHTTRADGWVLIPAALTGIAADLFKGGKMVHFLFQLPFNLNENSLSSSGDWSKIQYFKKLQFNYLGGGP